MGTTLLTQTLEQRLVRGATIKVADTSDNMDLRGVTTTIRSKKAVTCNGMHCAGSWCIGKAVFVVDPSVEASVKENVGWRHGAAKICLTHIQDVDGTNLIEPSSATVPVAEVQTRAVINSVTWENLAKASVEKDAYTLSVMARKLKVENESLIRRLIDSQAQVINAQAAALKGLSG